MYPHALFHDALSRHIYSNLSPPIPVCVVAQPENLLLVSESDDAVVKVADFGFAQKFMADSGLTTQCGTPGYVAPEILMRK